jgi:hypothetical protein
VSADIAKGSRVNPTRIGGQLVMDLVVCSTDDLVPLHSELDVSLGYFNKTRRGGSRSHLV